MAQDAGSAIAAILALVSIASGQGYLSAAAFSATKFVLDEATVGVATVIAAIKEYEAQASGSVVAKLTAALDAVKSNLGAALSAANITDAATQQTYVAEVNLVESLLVMVAGFFSPSVQMKTAKRVDLKAERKSFVLRFNANLPDAMKSLAIR